MNPVEINRILGSLTDDVSSVGARRDLLELCYVAAPFDSWARNILIDQTIWLIEHTPDDETPMLFFELFDTARYQEIRAAVLGAVESAPVSVVRRINAANLLVMSEPRAANQILEPVLRVPPESLNLCGVAGYTKSACAYVEDIAFERHMLLRATFHLYERAQTLANSAESAEDCEVHKSRVSALLMAETDWPTLPHYVSATDSEKTMARRLAHYQAAIDGHAALRDARLDLAIDALKCASLHFNQFSADPVVGPDFSLAERLLRAGAVSEVREYLSSAKERWTCPQQVAKWITEVDGGAREIDMRCRPVWLMW